MPWLKHITVDLIATIVIAIVVFYDTLLLEYVIYIYTALMVLARGMTLISHNFRSITEKNVSAAPPWFYHLLYFLNTFFLLCGTYYITASGWIFIWAVATYIHLLNRN